MNAETKNCQNCKQDFTIEPEDFEFYEKMKVPPPTFCPACRFQRRLSFLNVFSLYKRPCDLCKKDFVAMYAADSLYTVYCPKCWWSDGWDPYKYGRDYDFSRPFFEQFKELWRDVPLLGASLDLESTNSPYNNHAGHLKNTYLLFHADYTEDSAYGFYHVQNKSVFDCSSLMLCENCYDCKNAFKDNRCIGFDNSIESLDSVFLRDSRNCQHCFASANLRNKKYVFFNEQLTREEYFKRIGALDIGSYKVYQEVKARVRKHWKKYPPRPQYVDYSINSTGNYIFNSKNCKECYEVNEAEDSKYLALCGKGPNRDSYDVSSWGYNMSLCYEGCNVGENVSGVRFSEESGINLFDAEYCKLSMGGSHHFGCVSIKKGEYVIFNKKYSEKDFYEFRQRIVAHMQKMPYRDVNSIEYKYGEFFPPELSSFAYNETLARYFFPLSKEEALSKRYRWRDHEIPEQEITKSTDDVPDHIKDAPDSIVEEVIGCKTCGRGFRIIPMELAFLRRLNVPIPRECPFCRIDEKVQKWVKQLRLVSRTCDKCAIDFKTSFIKEDAPIIYCIKCYNAEVA